MAELQRILDEVCADDGLPGAVALVSRRGEPEVAYAGSRAEDGEPMTPDTIFRIASITKPIVAAATMALVERGRLSLDAPVAEWLPELADPVVLRRPDGPVDDVVPAERPITLRHLLTFTAGHGFPARFDAPIVQRLTEELHEGPPRPAERPHPDEWMRRLSGIPLLHQPGDGWTYNTGAEILGILLARATGASLPEVLGETILEPLDMGDTGFWTVETDRLATYYRRDDDGLAVVDPPDGQWGGPPPFESAGGGLLSTAADWHTFAQMVLGDGEYAGRQVLSAESVRLMTTSHVDGGPDHPFLDGQGWGFGGGVDLRLAQPWNVPGRYGWVGGTGTAGYVIPYTGTAVVWLSQVELAGPGDFEAMGRVLTYAAS